MRFNLILALAFLCPGASTTAFAHAVLQRASPPVDSETTTSPPELAITFSEAVEPQFSTIELRDANDTLVSTGPPHAVASGKRGLAVALPKLPPGTYTVIWHATSVDTHKTEGRYRFKITK